MSVPRLLDRLGAAIDGAVPAATSVGIAEPAAAGDLPAIVLHARSLSRSLRGIGDRPAPSRTGALAVTHSVDLAAPQLTFLDGSTATLLSDDRRSVFLPYGPAVAADGSTVDVLEPGDIDIDLAGTPITVVAGAPNPGQARGRPLVGVVELGAPAPATGILALAYFVGEWEVVVDRVQGDLQVDVWATTSAAVDDLSRAVDASLVPANRAGIAELMSVSPVSFGAIAPPSPNHGGGRCRSLVYLVDAEIEDVVLGGGGLIRTIDVTSHLDPTDDDVGLEQFSVPVP